MSSSSIEVEPWIHSQQQPHGDTRKETLLVDRATRRPSKFDSGRFARSTASSRLRAGGADSDTPDLEDLSHASPTPQTSTSMHPTAASVGSSRKLSLAPSPSTRRKSVATTDVRLTRKSHTHSSMDGAPTLPRANGTKTAVSSVKRPSIAQGSSPAASPRVRAMSTNKSVDNLVSRSPALKASLARRDQQRGPRAAPSLTYDPSETADESDDDHAVSIKETQRYLRRSLAGETTRRSRESSGGSHVSEPGARTMSIRSNSFLRSDTNSAKKTVEERQEGGLIRLVDALRDSLAEERKTTKREPGLHPSPSSRLKSRASSFSGASADSTTTASVPAVPTARSSLSRTPTDTTQDHPPARRTTNTKPAAMTTQTLNSRSAADIISNAKRRLSLSKDRAREVEGARPPGTTARRRTLSSGGSALQVNTEERRKSLANAHRQTPNNIAIQSYMKPTLAEQRRFSQGASPTLTRNGHSPKRASKPEHEPTSPQKANQDSRTGSRTRRRSTLRSAKSQRSETDRASCGSSASSHGGAVLSGSEEENKGRASTGDADEGQPSASAADVLSAADRLRTRKKSMAKSGQSPDPLTLSQRRLSRPDHGKEGAAGSKASPRLTTVATARKKSLVGQQETYTTKRLSRDSKTAVSRVDVAKRTAPTARKRGKTLPGSLAKPPHVPTLTLPPMKVEPIKLNFPKTARRTPKSRTAIHPKPNGGSRSTTLMGESATSPNGTSSEEDGKSPRRPSRLVPERRPSHLTSSDSPTSANVSPKTRPLNTQRTSVTTHAADRHPLRAVTNKNGKQSSTEASPLMVPSRIRKMSAASATGVMTRTGSLLDSSRKNSFASAAEQETTEKAKEPSRAMSLHEKLQAMVAQHTIKGNEEQYQDEAYAFTHDRRARRSQNYEIDEKYDHLLGGDGTRMERNRRSDSFLWDAEMCMPKSPELALQFCSQHLTPFERKEIRDYTLIYFVAPQALKNPGTNEARNWGYDDERGDYQIVMHDHLAYRYEVLEELGRGSFGQVVKCLDHKTGQHVAIKLIRNKKRFHAQALTEVKILKNLVEWDPDDEHHNLKMTDYFYFRNHLCIACECLSMNLYEFIKMHNFSGFNASLIKKFCLQMLQSLCLLYDHGVVHCDLKPENILLKYPNKSTIKVIDFGSSCLENERVYTYIQSRFYRAPEIILGQNYNMAIDMWSLGCILAELYTGIPLFPGENEQEQLQCIMEIMGQPDDYLIEQSSRRKLFFDSKGNARIIPNSRGKKRLPGAKTLAHAMRCHDAVFLDFVVRCLEWDPEKRMTPYEAFQHEWIVQSSRSSKPVTAASVKSTVVA